MTLDPARIVEALRAAAIPLKVKEIGGLLLLDADDRAALRVELRLLVDKGAVEVLPGRRFVIAETKAARQEQLAHGGPSVRGGVRGSVQRKASGIGWFVPLSKTANGQKATDGFLPPDELRSLIDGDKVEAVLRDGHKGPVAQVVRLLEQTRTLVTGTLRVVREARGIEAFVEIDDNLLSGPVQIAAADRGEAVDGDVVEVKLRDRPTAMRAATGAITRTLGKRGGLDVEIERLMIQSGIPGPFPADVLLEAERLPPHPLPHETAGRDDLRELPICTIDGETAKDFDDAVYADVQGKDIHIVVCVADVSHYVTAGSALDREARARGTSVYYPGKVTPMLPEALSNGLCSLNPHVDRLCAVARFIVGPSGAVSNEALSFGIMRSQARLTYTRVQQFLDDPRASANDIPMAVRTSLLGLAEAATRLRQARMARGSIDFELPETIVALDAQRAPTAIVPVTRLFAHKLIEDLMIAANEASARFFEQQQKPTVYRIHEPPNEEKLAKFMRFADTMEANSEQGERGARPTKVAKPAKPAKKGRGRGRKEDDEGGEVITGSMLMARMAKIGAHPARAALDMLLLRSLKQAVYAVDNLGHFGLGSEAYLHFTSPIRRYPDLIVHRRMRAELLATAKKTRKGSDGHADALIEDLEDIAMTSSQLERRSAELERQIQALYAAWLMKDRVGESHEAIITGMSESGIFVRLTELHVEGMIRLGDWQGDHFFFDEEALQLRGERTGRILKLGETLTVDVIGVDLARRQVAFAPTGQAPMQRRDAFPQRAFEAPRPMDRPHDRDSRPDSRHDDRSPPRGRPERKEPKRNGPEPRKRRGPSSEPPSTLGGEDTNPRMRRGEERPHADERRKQDPYRGKKPAPQRAPEPTTPAARPVIRGPDDLRNLFGNGGAKPPAKRPR